MITLIVTQNEDMTTTYTVVVPNKDVTRVRLDSLERSYIYGPASSVADEILKLGQLTFRIEQQRKMEETGFTYPLGVEVVDPAQF